jgi:gas vesicle protein
MECTIDKEHQIRTAGLWEEYQNYKVWTKMIVYGKAKLDSYKQSIDELKEEYEMIGSDGKVTETWKLPKPISEVKAEIQELIDYGENEIKELEVKREEAFDKLREKNYEHYI